MRNESVFKAALMKYLELAGCHAQRIENKMSSGIPDINACFKKADFWIEAKHVKTIRKNNTFDMDLSPLQRQWCIDRYKAGGKVFVVACFAKELRKDFVVYLPHMREAHFFCTIPGLVSELLQYHLNPNGLIFPQFAEDYFSKERLSKVKLPIFDKGYKGNE